MAKKAALLGAALLVFLTSQLHVGCRVLVYGAPLEGVYSPAAASRAAGAASRAAEELLGGPAAFPRLAVRWRVCLRPPSEDSAGLAARLLDCVPGVAAADTVFVNGRRLGTVEDGGELLRRLETYITGQQPRAAVSGSLSGQVRVERLYGPACDATNYDDMVLLITGMAPVLYMDENGRPA